MVDVRSASFPLTLAWPNAPFGPRGQGPGLDPAALLGLGLWAAALDGMERGSSGGAQRFLGARAELGQADPALLAQLDQGRSAGRSQLDRARGGARGERPLSPEEQQQLLELLIMLLLFGGGERETQAPAPARDLGPLSPGNWSQGQQGSWPSTVGSTPGAGQSAPGQGASTVAPSSGNGPATGRAAQALEWSAAQMNPATGTGVNSNNGLSVAQDINAWNNWCLAFVSTAYGRSVPELAAGSAIESYRKFAAAGKIVNDRNPPAGAPVFFDATSSNAYGHIAIATGKTTADGDPIIRTSGWPGRPGIWEVPLSELERMTPGYLGWGVTE